MKDKKYLDKVIGYLVRGTKIDYDKDEIIFPFTTRATPVSLGPPLPLPSPPPLPRPLLSFLRSFPFSLPFVKYCNGQFGLTEEEIEYVYYRYKKIINNKISNGE